MKRAFLLMVVPALLVALGFAQTPAASSNTDQTKIKGCLGGSDGNYTVVEDNTGHIYKIATSSVDLKPHVGHDVTLIGNKASGASSATADNSVAVTELNMISEHCAAAAAVPVGSISTPAETTVTPTVADAVPATTISTPADAIPPAVPDAAPVPPVSTTPQTAVTPAAAPAAPPATTSTPAETAVTPTVAAAAPAATTSLPAETTVTPAAAAAPAATVSTPAETVVTPAAAAVHPTRLPARSRRTSATPAAAPTTPAVTAGSSSAATAKTDSTPDAAATTPAATANTSSETDSTPAAAPTTPTAPARRGSLWLLIGFAVLVIVLGILAPSLSRWRKRKSLERTGAPNLSFTRDASSDKAKSDEAEPRKVA